MSTFADESLAKQLQEKDDAMYAKRLAASRAGQSASSSLRGGRRYERRINWQGDGSVKSRKTTNVVHENFFDDFPDDLDE